MRDLVDSFSSFRSHEHRRLAIVSSFPPTACGIATFSAALAGGLIANGYEVDVVRCGTAPDLDDPLVVAALGDGTAIPVERALAAVDGADAVIVQHEYGIYDGPDGAAIVPILMAIDVPIIVVAHTVLHAPTPSQRWILEQVCSLADVVVVMTESGRLRLEDEFGVPSAKVVVIPHGAATPPAAPDISAPPAPVDGTTLLTWGLLGPGKGIEWAIDALALLADIDPAPRYLVAGATHPKVRSRHGDAYRDMLRARSASRGLAASVTFDDTYRDVADLTALIQTAHVVVLPYDSVDQVTSGVLVDAVAAGRPVIATAFPHAVELLASGAGIVVPQRDPGALADAIRSLVTDQALVSSMAAEARRLGPELSWDAVAARYGELALGLEAGDAVPA